MGCFRYFRWQRIEPGHRQRAFAALALAVQSANGDVHQRSQPRTSPPDSGMKARSSNVVIGATALAVIAVALAGLLGYQKIHGIRQRGPLRIIFEGSASGLHKGGAVNFDGVQVGEIRSLKLETPRRIVAFVRVDNSAPIRKDTIVGLEFQGLTGVAAISLTGGDAAADPVPLDKDGIPTLRADLTEIETVRDTLHNVDRFLVTNQAATTDALLNFENYTATLADKGEAIDSMLRKADTAFGSFDSTIAGIDNIVPGLADGKDGELFQKMKSIRELAESFNKRSAVFMEDGRRSLLDIDEAAIKVTRKFDGPPGAAGGAPPPAGPRQKRQ
jgi:phospholipid/cholesterol/gamma-HCH transport system substrate-binding protein